MNGNASVDAMWLAFCTASGTSLDVSRDVSPFGDSTEIADELADLIVCGIKHATASLLADCVDDDGTVSPGEVGDLSVVVDGADRARCVVRTTEIRIGPFKSVDDSFAYDEGEGDRSRGAWLEIHECYFRRRCEDLHIVWSPDLAVVFERFELIWTER